MSALKLKRRTMLRGLLQGAAVSIGLPPLEAMFNRNGTAHADGTALPKRMGIFFWGNGVRLAQWNPAAVGPGWALSPALMPLAALKDYVSVVSGMNIKTGNQQGHHAGAVGILSGGPMVSQPKGTAPYRSTFSIPSIDQVAAAQLGTTTRFKSLELGISRRVIKGEGTTLWYLSHNGPDSTNPPIYDPAAVFTRVFGGGTVTGPTVDPTVAKVQNLRKSVLDAVLSDLDALKMRASSADKTRLDQHLENVRSIEKRLQSPTMSGVGAAQCSSPKAPTGTFADQGGKEQMEPVMTAMSQLVALALACDQTRVFSMLFSGAAGYTSFWEVGSTAGIHDLTHDEAGDQPQVQAAVVFTMKMFALLLQALKNTPEGAGNLLDNCAIMASTDLSEGLSHSPNDYPILIAGKAGGALKYPSVHYRSKGENTSLVLMSLLRAVGLPLTEFGAGGGKVTTGCTAIEA